MQLFPEAVFSTDPFQTDKFILLVELQGKLTLDAVVGDKWSQVFCRKLHAPAILGLHYYLARQPLIIGEVAL